MDFRYLRAFQAAFDTLHFGRAAQRLRIAPSALSRQIALLESSLGQKLFLRNNREIIPTPVARELRKRLEGLSAFERELRGTHRHRVRLGCLEGVFYACVLARLTPKAIRDCERLETHLFSPDELRSELEAGRLDAAVGNFMIENHVFTSRLLGQQRRVLIARDKEMLRNWESVPRIFGETGSGFLKLTKRPAAQELVVNSLPAIFKWVEAGLGVAVVPEAGMMPQARVVVDRTRSLPPEKVYLVTRNARDPASEWVRGLLTGALSP